MQKMSLIKVRDVKTPEYGTPGSAGIDFFVPEDFHQIDLHPGESFLIPSGIKAKVPDGMVLIAFNKSGVATKKRLQVGAAVVDSDYQGEIHLHVYNTAPESSGNSVIIEPGMKLVQFILLPYSHAELELCQTLEEVFPVETVRGEGGFGSTNMTGKIIEGYQTSLEMTHT